MQTLYCGLDLHSTSFYVVAMDKDGAVVHEDGRPTGEAQLVRAFTQLPGKLSIHLESSDLAGWARALLLERVPTAEQVVASHPKANSWVGKDPLKDDRIDAWKLADMIRCGQLHEVYFPDDEKLAIFKKTVQHYEAITDQQARLKLNILARLRAEGVIARSPGAFSEAGRELITGAIEDPFRREAIQQLYRLHEHEAEAQQEAFDLMKRQAGHFPVIERLQEVPGLGLRLACRFVAYIQNPHRFATKRKLWRYCRLGITRPESNGKPLRYQKLDHNGVGRLKDLSRKAFHGAMACGKSNVFQRFYNASSERTGNADHARLSTQRKILTVLWTLWKKGTRYDDNYMG